MAFDFTRALAGQKAIPSHPALLGGAPVSIYSPGAVRKQSKLSQREASRHLEGYGGHEAIDWLMDCVRLYSDTASTADWKLSKAGVEYVTEKTPDMPKGTKVAPSDLVNLLERPNPYMLYDELIDLLVIDLLLVGNHYWYKYKMNAAGKPLALYRLAPPYVKVVPDEFGVASYEYQPPNAAKPLKLNAKEVVHYKLSNPHSAYYGLGLVQGGGRPLDLEISLADTQAAYYENRADPSMIVTSDRRVPRDVFNKLRAQLRARTSGPKKAGELLILEAGLKATSLSPTARDALFTDVSIMSRDRIMAMFRASPKLFGIVDEGSTGDKVSDSRREFDTKTMRRFLDKLERRVSEGVTKAWGFDFKIDYRYVMPLEELVKLAGDFATTPGIKVKEVRRFLAPTGIPESTGDASIDEMVLNLPGTNLGPDGQPVSGGAGFPDQPIGSEPGRPVTRTSKTKAFPKNGAPLPAGAQARRPAGKALLEIDEISARLAAQALFMSAGKALKPDNRLTGEVRPEDSFEVARAADLDSAAAFVKRNLATAALQLQRDLQAEPEGKAVSLDRIKKSKAWKTFQETLVKHLTAGVVRAISSAVIHQSEAGRNLEEPLDYEAVAKEQIHRPDGARGIVETLKASVAKAAEGADTKAAQDTAIADVLAKWTDGKAETIGYTETVRGYNEATLLVAEANGVSEVYVTDGQDFDEPCVEAHGNVWTIEQARANPLEHPNCRRAFLPI